MKFKQLVWEDKTTDVGKERGLIYLVADVKGIDVHYIISNMDNYNVFFLEIDNGPLINISSIEEGKEKGQMYFEEKIKTLFFEKNTRFKWSNINSINLFSFEWWIIIMSGIVLFMLYLYLFF